MEPMAMIYTPSSKVCPMLFHLERHFCLILNWNFTWNDIFLHIFLVNDSIRLFANSENKETVLYDISHLLLLPAPKLYKRMLFNQLTAKDFVCSVSRSIPNYLASQNVNIGAD